MFKMANDLEFKGNARTSFSGNHSLLRNRVNVELLKYATVTEKAVYLVFKVTDERSGRQRAVRVFMYRE